MSISKIKTSKCKHYTSDRIVSAFLDKKIMQAKVTFMDERGTERTFPVTKDEFAHIVNGAGTDVPAFEGGLTKAFRYRFSICTDMLPDPTYEAPNGDIVPMPPKVETVVAIHAVPTPIYMDSDWTAELERPIPEGGIMVTVRPNGGIDLVSFPAKFRGIEGGVLTKLEDMDSISMTTEFTVANVRIRTRSATEGNIMLVGSVLRRGR